MRLQHNNFCVKFVAVCVVIEKQHNIAYNGYNYHKLCEIIFENCMNYWRHIQVEIVTANLKLHSFEMTTVSSVKRLLH